MDGGTSVRNSDIDVHVCRNAWEFEKKNKFAFICFFGGLSVMDVLSGPAAF